MRPLWEDAEPYQWREFSGRRIRDTKESRDQAVAVHGGQSKRDIPDLIDDFAPEYAIRKAGMKIQGRGPAANSQKAVDNVMDCRLNGIAAEGQP